VITINILIIDSGVNIECAQKANFVPYESDIDYLGHGTVIAKIIRAINPNANIYSAKIIDKGGTTLNNKLVEALVYASTHNIDIINISLGLTNYSDTVNSWINRLIDNGTTIIAAAGNNNYYYPALYSRVISVGSLNDDNTIASYSAQANVYTYGSVTINSKTYTGTSYSAAIITGILSTQ
jgi:hypothetical protein